MCVYIGVHIGEALQSNITHDTRYSYYPALHVICPFIAEPWPHHPKLIPLSW